MSKNIVWGGMLAFCLLFAVSAQAQEKQEVSPIYRAGQVAVVAANLADIHSTMTGWKLGLVETNPVIGTGNTGRLIGYKSLSIGINLTLMYMLKKTGHDKAAGWVGMAMSSYPAYAAIHNYRLNARVR